MLNPLHPHSFAGAPIRRDASWATPKLTSHGPRLYAPTRRGLGSQLLASHHGLQDRNWLASPVPSRSHSAGAWANNLRILEPTEKLEACSDTLQDAHTSLLPVRTFHRFLRGPLGSAYFPAGRSCGTEQFPWEHTWAVNYTMDCPPRSHAVAPGIPRPPGNKSSAQSDPAAVQRGRHRGDWGANRIWAEYVLCFR